MGDTVPSESRTPFVHEALLYEGDDGFVASTAPFLREGLEAGEAVLVVAGRDRLERLRTELDGGAERLTFLDMAEIGRNPARILPVWLDFAKRAGGAPCRGIGEPIWPGRAPAERAEGHRHEHLLNLALAGVRGLRILCPYDVSGLDPGDVEEARRSHPFVQRGSVRDASLAYAGPQAIAGLEQTIPDPPAHTARLIVTTPEELADLRRWVVSLAGRARLEARKAADLVQAASELAANSLRYGGGRALVRSWTENGTLICEVRDDGHIRDPLVGRVRPAADQDGGRGLWMVNQLADLVELHSSETGTVVRLHVYGASPPRS